MRQHTQCQSACQSQRRWPVTIDLKRDELLYDIKNMSYVEGEMMPEQNQGHERHMVQDIAEVGNIDRVSRILELAHAECIEALFPFTKKEIEPITWQNNEPKCEFCNVYTIEMHMPVAFSQTTVTLLRNCIHDYMVDRVLEDWLSITNPPASAKWKEKAEDSMTAMKEAVNFRVGRVRRRQSPF